MISRPSRLRPAVHYAVDDHPFCPQRPRTPRLVTTWREVTCQLCIRIERARRLATHRRLPHKKE